MGRNTSGFFSMVSKLEDSILVSGINLSGEPYSQLSKTAIQALVQFIKSGSWSDSKVFKFIGLYYRESYQNLVYYWNLKYGNQKSEATFRNQKMKAGSYLETMLGSVSQIESAFLSEDDEALTELCIRIKLLSSSDMSLTKFVDADFLAKVLSERDYTKSYEVADCKEEIGFLISLCYENINKCAKSLDMQKLGYLCSVLQSPLLDKGKLNTEKIDLVTKLRYGIDGSTLDLRVSVANFAKSFVAESETGAVSTLEKRCEDLERENMELRMRLEEGGGSDTIAIGDLNIPASVWEAIYSAEDIDSESVITMETFSAFLAALSCCDSYLMRSLVENLPPKILSSLKWYLFNKDFERYENIMDFMADFRDYMVTKEGNSRILKYVESLNSSVDRFVAEKNKSE